jgi:ATP-dependent protease HslVU (ClpYQ) peptidase subunit
MASGGARVTCIVGLVDAGKVYIGGDSASTSGWDLTLRADPKVFRNGNVIMGFTTSYRMGQLLRYAFKPPLHDPDLDVLAYLTTAFVNGVRDCLKAGGYALKEKEQESAGSFVLGYRGGLYAVDSDYQVVQPADAYAAVGCGAAYALGALSATPGQDPEARIRLALAAAEHHSAGVRGPFVVEVLG